MNYSKPNHCTHNRTYIFPKILRSNTNTTLFEPRFPHVESQIFWLMKSTHIRNTQTRFGGFSVGSSCQTCHHTNLPLLGWKLQCAKALNQGISSNPKVCCNVSASGSSYLIWKFAKLGLEQLRPASQMPHQSKTPSCLYIPLQKKAGRSRLGILGFGTGWVVDSHLEKSHHITTILRPKVPLGWTKTTKKLPV